MNNFKPLEKAIPISAQKWPESTLPLVATSTLTFNHSNYIRDCIEGILMQKTTFPVKICIFEDCSTDGTQEIIKEYVAEYPQLFAVSFQHENTYKKPNRRKSLYEFKQTRIPAKYISLCEGDDYWTDPFKLQKQVDFLEQNPDYSACFTNAIVKDFFSGEEKLFVLDISEGLIQEKDIFIHAGGLFPTASLTYKAYDLESLEKLMMAAGLSGDTILLFQLFTDGNIYFKDEATCVYRKWKGGVYSSLKKDPLKFEQYKFNEINGYQKLNVYTHLKYSKWIQERIYIIHKEIITSSLKWGYLKYFFKLPAKHKWAVLKFIIKKALSTIYK